MSDIELDYDYLTQNALRRVVFEVLSITSDLGEAPGDHHFYIEFKTHAPGVEIPDHLRHAYPERMTIVLQHQFSDLTVFDDHFSVKLFFKKREASLSIPFAAITSFADPSVQYGLRFDVEAGEARAGAAGPARPARDGEAGSSENGPSEEEDDEASTGDVVSLDAFRKK